MSSIISNRSYRARGQAGGMGIGQGWGYVVIRRPDGTVKQLTEFKNLATNNAVSQVLSMLGSVNYLGSAATAATAIFGYGFIGQGTDSGPIASADTTVSTETGSRIQACAVFAFPRYTWSVVFGSGNPAGGDSIRQIGAYFSATGTGASLLGFKASLSNSVIKGTADTATYVWIVSIND